MTREAQEIVERLARKAADECMGNQHSGQDIHIIAQTFQPVVELIEAAQHVELDNAFTVTPNLNKLRSALNRLRDAAGHSK